MSNQQHLSVSVVVPVRNEETQLSYTLESLLNQTAPPEQVIVVDGGSRDRTREVAASFPVELLTVTSGGRGNQIAQGVAVARGAIVVIAHADMVFPTNSLERIRQHLMEHPACPGGALGHRFCPPRWRYRLMEWCDARRAQRGNSYGDQAQFFRREWLNAAGGFPALPIMEDVELAKLLRKLGPSAYLDCPVVVSPRRFERLGFIRAIWQNWRFRRAYHRSGLAAVQSIFDIYYPSRTDSR